MKKNIFYTFTIINIFLFFECFSQCDILRVTIKDTVAINALKDYVSIGKKEGILSKEQGIVLLNIDTDLTTGVKTYGVSITHDNFYEVQDWNYTNYTIIDNIIFLIEFSNSAKKIVASNMLKECIQKIVGTKVSKFVLPPKRVRILASGEEIILKDIPKLELKMMGTYYLQDGGKYKFKENL